MELVEKLRAMGFHVTAFVIRVEGHLDVFLPSGKWRDLRTGQRGKVALEEIPKFVEERLCSEKK